MAKNDLEAWCRMINRWAEDNAAEREANTIEFENDKSTRAVAIRHLAQHLCTQERGSETAISAQPVAYRHRLYQNAFNMLETWEEVNLRVPKDILRHFHSGSSLTIAIAATEENDEEECMLCDMAKMMQESGVCESVHVPDGDGELIHVITDKRFAWLKSLDEAKPTKFTYAGAEYAIDGIEVLPGDRLKITWQSQNGERGDVAFCIWRGELQFDAMGRDRDFVRVMVMAFIAGGNSDEYRY